MVFTYWVGRPESAQGSGCLCTPPQITLKYTKSLSESSLRKNKLTDKISSWVFVPHLAYIHFSYLLPEKRCSKWQRTTGPSSCMLGR